MTKTYTVGTVLNRFKDELFKRIEAIRNGTDKEKKGELKKQLRCVCFSSEPIQKRETANCRFNGIICLDFDNVENIDEAKQAIAAVQYIFAVGLSASGKGLFALAAVKGTSDLKKVTAAMQADFQFLKPKD
ncbi:hypothetical protein FACS189454_06320 [Planctomycetales bacterium]|nr:hypothetical protein FACS189454_06320 [Planctomycetales bacterium]